jgi:carbamoyl-phosphate synthase large subunit
MRSTGETMGLDASFAPAFAKAHLGAGHELPLAGTVFVSVKEGDKEITREIVRDLLGLGFDVVSTRGTTRYMHEHGLTGVRQVNKVREGRPHIVDMMVDGEIDLVINTTEGTQSIADSYSIRRTALMRKIPYSTTIAGSRAIVEAIASIRNKGGLEVKALQEYF